MKKKMLNCQQEILELESSLLSETGDETRDTRAEEREGKQEEEEEEEMDTRPSTRLTRYLHSAL